MNLTLINFKWTLIKSYMIYLKVNQTILLINPKIKRFFKNLKLITKLKKYNQILINQIHKINNYKINNYKITSI